jgi:hypothetical protein
MAWMTASAQGGDNGVRRPLPRLVSMILAWWLIPCYRYFHCMQLYIFNSDKDPDVVGFTKDACGANLPSDLGPWTASGSRALPIGIEIDALVPVLTAIEEDGFYLARGGNV